MNLVKKYMLELVDNYLIILLKQLYKKIEHYNYKEVIYKNKKDNQNNLYNQNKNWIDKIKVS